MKKILILYNYLWFYRIPIFNILTKKYDVTVAYSLGEVPNNLIDFKIIKIPIWKIGRFVIHKRNLMKYCNNFDVVICHGDLAWLSLMALGFFKRSFSLIYWSIGVRASYNTNYGEKTLFDKLRYYLFFKADALIFYTDVPIPRYLKRGWTERKLFVANNTVKVIELPLIRTKKDRIIFVGTLYKQKGIFLLLNAYVEAIEKNKNLPDLHIIGGGVGLNDVKLFVKNNGLVQNVVVHGPVYNENILKLNFTKSLACISPNQAGLSVLKSMGYGCPFITKMNAITGGEIFNIKNNINGILYEHDSELIKILIDIAEKPNKYIRLGEMSYEFYHKYRKPEDMAQGIIDSIEEVTKGIKTNQIQENMA